MNTPPLEKSESADARRDFLKRAGRFAAVTPPAMALLLSTATVPKQAFASSIGLKGNNGWGNGGDDGTNPGSDNGNDLQSSTKSSDANR
jgi:hypothetical protein